MFPTPQVLFFAFAGGLIPAVLWLWFWLKEDRLHPEPKGYIMLCFFLGMLSVLPALYLERWSAGNDIAKFGLSLTIIITWAVIEEFLKYLAAYIGALKKTECDEPIDSMIYMISAALGFAAVENTLFLLNVVNTGNVLESIKFGGLRFVGATVLHIVTSGIIGLFIALAFYKSSYSKKMYTFLGLIVAVCLHTLFNLFIIKGEGNNTFIVFFSLWAIVVVILVLFEKIKRLQAPRSKIR